MADPWADAVKQHQVFGLIDEFERNLEAAMARDVTPDGAAALQRALTVLGVLRIRLLQAPAALVPVTSLNNALPHAQNANGEIAAFLSDQNEGHFATANSYVDALIMEWRWLPQTAFRREAKAFIDAADEFASSLNEREQAVRGSLSALEAEIGSRKKEFSDTSAGASQRMDALLTSTSASVAALSAQLESTSNQLRTEVEAQKTRLDSYFEQQQAAHLQTSQQRQTEFNEALESFEADAKTRLDAVIREGTDRQTAVAQEAGEAVQRLHGYEENAKAIIGVTASAGVTGTYINEADAQKKTADIWRIVASILLFAVVAGAIATTVWSPLNGNVSSEKILEYGITRVPIVVVLGGVFTYAAKQSAEHRERERNARRRAMELTAFNPFIAMLPIDEQQRLVAETARKYFRGEQEPQTGADA